MLSRSSPAFYAIFRRSASVAAFALAAVWIADRAGVASFSTVSGFDHPAVTLVLLPGLLWLAALASYGRHRLSDASPRVSEV
jgi:hypothetical protein